MHQQSGGAVVVMDPVAMQGTVRALFQKNPLLDKWGYQGLLPVSSVTKAGCINGLPSTSGIGKGAHGMFKLSQHSMRE